MKVFSSLNRNLLMPWALIQVLVVLSGCASHPPLMPITDSNERITFKGFSVLPPSGKDWNWVGRENQDKSSFSNTTFFKGKGLRTTIAIAEILNASNKNFESIDDVRKWANSADFLGSELSTNNLSLGEDVDRSMGFPCLRYDGEKDSRSPKFPGKVFDHDAHGYLCLHPDDKNFVANISCSRRSPKGEPHIAGRDECEKFINSLELTPL